jgi:hypothetical protein
MEANYEAGHLFQHSPRLVAVHPKLLPVPSEGAPTDELDAPEELFASLLEKSNPWDFRDAWTRSREYIDSQFPHHDGLYLVSYRDIQHEIYGNFTGEECTLTPNSTEHEPSPSPQRNTPVYYDFPSLEFNDSELPSLVVDSTSERAFRQPNGTGLGSCSCYTESAATNPTAPTSREAKAIRLATSIQG